MPAENLVVVGGAAVVGYFGYQWWVREQAKAALLAEATALQQRGMSVKDSITQAAAGACTAAAAAYKVPPEAAGPLCNGAAVVAMKAAELTAKGAVIAGKAIGKGAIVAGAAVGHVGAVVGKDVGHAGAAVGKGVAKGSVFVAYKAPKAIIGGAVNTADKVASKLVGAIVPRVVMKAIPKPVKKVAAVAKKVVKKALCLGIFCGLDGIDMYGAALADAGPRNPLEAHARRAGGGRLVGAATSSAVQRAGRARSIRPTGRAYYASLL